MKTVICLCGISGSGKTYYRTRDPELSKLPYVDIADVYKELKTNLYYVAWDGLIDRIRQILKTQDKVVVEAAFTWNQRNKIYLLAQYIPNLQFEFIEMPIVDRQTLLSRIQHDLDKSQGTQQDINYYQARVSMINNLAPER